MTAPPDIEHAHQEVFAALAPLGRPQRGEAVRLDRGSQMVHLGVPTPELRARVRQGFSFDRLPIEARIALWDAIWQRTEVADVQLAALAHCTALARRQPPPGLWERVRHWPSRIDNWCTSDALSLLLARLLQARPDAVYPQLQRWNAAQELWPRRLSITSLVHGWGTHAMFLPPESMRPLLANCVADHRHYIELALGWVLRELGRAEPAAADAFLIEHGAAMGAKAWSRALQLRSAADRQRLAAASGRGAARRGAGPGAATPRR